MTIIKNYFAITKNTKFIHMLHNYILSPLNPWFITGFVYTEGCFLISVFKELKTK